MDCNTVRDAIVEALIEPRGADTQAIIDAHIAGCPSCAAFADKQYALDRQLSATLAPPVLDAGFRAAVRARARLEARTFWFDLLPDAMHFAGCGVVTAIGLVWLPLSVPIVLAGAAVGTVLTHMLLMAAHDSLDAAEEITS
jgi:predicted anti-sigma-YlaC factor YlaD